MTPDSVISVMRSLPSRVRSPTPANTEVPPKFWATRGIISWMSTVLPTPAPPNRPILPPTTYGVSRSSTLMPVSSISVLPSSWSNAGALRWMPHSSPVISRSGSSRHSPSALNTWPLTWSPTGTEIGRPRSVTSWPRTRPSVGCIEMVRTRLSPRCWATSRVSVFASVAEGHLEGERVVELRHLVARELDVDDRAGDPDDPAGRRSGCRVSAVAVISSHFLRSRERRRHRRSH